MNKFKKLYVQKKWQNYRFAKEIVLERTKIIHNWGI